MAERGILGRLVTGRRSSDSDDAVRASVVAHLRVLLNAQLGQALTRPTLGLVDFAELKYLFPDSARVLEDSVRSLVSEFEPRLRNVRVRYQQGDDPMSVRLEISAVLATGRGRRRARFATQINPSGEFEVSMR